MRLAENDATVGASIAAASSAMESKNKEEMFKS